MHKWQKYHSQMVGLWQVYHSAVGRHGSQEHELVPIGAVLSPLPGNHRGCHFDGVHVRHGNVIYACCVYIHIYIYVCVSACVFTYHMDTYGCMHMCASDHIHVCV